MQGFYELFYTFADNAITHKPVLNREESDFFLKYEKCLFQIQGYLSHISINIFGINIF